MGQVRPICRPTEHQRVVYNGHKRVHALKYQNVTAVNGMIANLFGPIEGRRHDSYMLRESGLLLELEHYSQDVDGNMLCIYGDPAYPIRAHLQSPFKGNVTPEQEAYNRSMSSVRVSVEWLFGDIINNFKFIDYKKKSKSWIVCHRQNVPALWTLDQCPHLSLWKHNFKILRTGSTNFNAVFPWHVKHTNLIICPDNVLNSNNF